MIFTIAAAVLSLGNIVMMASLSVFGIFVVFAFVNFSLIWLRFKQPNLIRTFTSPFKIKKFPILAGIGLLPSVLMIFEFEKNITISVYLIIICIIILCVLLTMTQKKSKPGTN